MADRLTLHISHGVLASMVTRDIERWIEVREQRRARLFLSEKDKLRLLRLRIWSMRYKISILEILDLIVPVFRKKFRLKGQGKGLGIPVSTLTGAVAEEILQDRLTEQYPDGANITAWKFAERERQLDAERMDEADGMAVREPKMPTLLEVGDVAEYSRIYAERVAQTRAAQSNQDWRKRRMYRDNPWR